MAAQNFELSERHQAFIREAVANGTYENESAVVNAAMTLLEEQMGAYPERLEALQALVREGFDQFERGEYITLATDADVDAFMDGIEAKYRTPEAG